MCNQQNHSIFYIRTENILSTYDIIIDAPAVVVEVVVVEVVHLNKYVDLTSIFVTTAALLCKHAIVNKHM